MDIPRPQSAPMTKGQWKARRREVANQMAQARNAMPDARARFAIIKAKRDETPGFKNVIDENGQWV